MNQGWTYCDRISPRFADMTVLDYYTQRYRHSTRSEWQQRIEGRQILLDQRPVQPQAQLKAGQQLPYQRPPWQEPPAPVNIDILYQDKHLLVVNKPSGLPVLPGANFLQHTLLWQVQQQYPNAYPIHRLGRGTSGLTLLANSPAARRHLSRQMRQRQIRKLYWAIVLGTRGHDAIPETFITEQPIGKCPHPLLGHVYGAATDGLAAKSQGRVLSRGDGHALVEVAIATGRPHQIRIHLAALGYPLVGDPLYTVGGQPRPDAVPGDCGYQLHACELDFIHPSTGNLQQIQHRPNWSI